MNIVVSDTSPIRALDHLGLVDVLGTFFGTVYVPPAVAQELANPSIRLTPVDLKRWPFIIVRAPTDAALTSGFAGRVDKGEAEALSLAVEIKAASILIDEKKGRRIAREVGLLPVGVVAILVQAKQAGHINAVAPLIDRLRTEITFFISDALRQEALTQAGEHP